MHLDPIWFCFTYQHQLKTPVLFIEVTLERCHTIDKMFHFVVQGIKMYWHVLLHHTVDLFRIPMDFCLEFWRRWVWDCTFIGVDGHWGPGITPQTIGIPISDRDRLLSIKPRKYWYQSCKPDLGADHNHECFAGLVYEGKNRSELICRYRQYRPVVGSDSSWMDRSVLTDLYSGWS